jgi:hypothetical protein
MSENQPFRCGVQQGSVICSKLPFPMGFLWRGRTAAAFPASVLPMVSSPRLANSRQAPAGTVRSFWHRIRLAVLRKRPASETRRECRSLTSPTCDEMGGRLFWVSGFGGDLPPHAPSGSAPEDHRTWVFTASHVAIDERADLSGNNGAWRRSARAPATY